MRITVTTMIVLLLILFLLTTTSFKGYDFVKRDNLQLKWDEYEHYELSIYYFARLFRHSLLFAPISPINHKAPLFYLIITLSYLFFPVTQDTTRIANLFYIILILIMMSIIEWNVSRKRIYSPFIFFIIPVNPKVQHEKRFCKAYFKNKEYFLAYYNNSRIIGRFNISV